LFRRIPLEQWVLPEVRDFAGNWNLYFSDFLIDLECIEK
jgi:hypothetical protein